ncbi:hypothetical protein ACHAW6_004774 [Cyclotella cf. meneghiniana]
MNCYQLLLGEFHPVPGDGMKEHSITKGANCRETKYEQQWKHRHSDYVWTWHCKFGKPGEFETDKLWKVTRAVIKSMAPGFIHLKHILKLSGKSIGLRSDDAPKYRREDDMMNRVLAVIAAICSKFPLSVYDNEVMRWYPNELNPKHC